MRIVILIVSLLWYQHSAQRNIEMGHDFSIYIHGTSSPEWLYPEYVSVLFEPLRGLPFHWAFGIFYALNVLAWWTIARKFHWAWVLTIYPALLILESGNVTMLLAALAITPMGAVAATLVKPYCAVFVLLHAIRRYQEHHRKLGAVA